jgi:hypothetical protein
METQENVIIVNVNGKQTAIALVNTNRRRTLVTFPGGKRYELEDWDGGYITLKGYPEKLQVMG